MSTKKMAKLGSHLEWHGSKIRVVVIVPPSARKALGKTKLRSPLETSSPRAAEALKWSVIERLKREIASAKAPAGQADVVREALVWRRAMADNPGTGEPGEVTVRDVMIDDAIPQVAKERGQDAADLMQAIAERRVTPLAPLVEEMIQDRGYPLRSKQKLQHAAAMLDAWCAKRGIAPAVESFDTAEARRFFRETFILPGRNPVTANETAKWCGRWWRWMMEAGHLPDADKTVWDKQRMAENDQMNKATGQAKRPFTDAEVAKLMAAVDDAPLPDFMRCAALTGIRPKELASLTVADVVDGCFVVRLGKTANAIRTIPVHSALGSIVTARTTGKGSAELLFGDLPGEGAVSPYAALSKRFTRRRRALGIGERRENNQQDTADFYSFRRWFTLKARAALESGAAGFSPWTLADVVGHSKEAGDLPLDLTMRRYPGDASLEAKRACVEAVTLPG